LKIFAVGLEVVEVLEILDFLDFLDVLGKMKIKRENKI